MKERTLVDNIRKALKEKGVKVVKVHGNAMMEAGTPDLIACHQGQTYLWEVKVGKNRPTELQLRRLDEWEKAGAITAVVWSVASAMAVLEGK